MKLDIGCGKNKKEGFIGIDRIKFDGVDLVFNIVKRIAILHPDPEEPLADPLYEYNKLPYEESSVDEIHFSHALEHFTGVERAHILNEFYRVLKNGSKAHVIVPYWCSNRAYGDITHQWPPVSEMFWYYLDPAWREGNAPHCDSKYVPHLLKCNFAATWGYSLHQTLPVRSPEYQQYAMQFYKEACQDTIATLTARKD